MTPIRTLLVGYGLSGRAFHAPFLLSNPAYELVGIVQPGGDAARKAFPRLHHYKSLEQALQVLSCELVIITAPNEQHAPLARMALMAGRHVVVEKPFALTVAEAKELMSLAHAQQRVLSVYHNRRWDADFLTIQALLQEQKVGRPVMMLSRFDRYRPQIKQGWKEVPAPGSGIFYDLGPHLLDQALVLFGWPVSLYAQLRLERAAARTPDAFDLFLYYPQLTVHLAAGSLVSAPLPRFCLMGTEGSYTKWGMDPQEAALRRGEFPVSAEWGMESSDQWGLLVDYKEGEPLRTLYPSKRGNYGSYYDLLASALRKGGQNPLRPEEALQVMQLLELAEQSHQQGKQLFTVSADEARLG